jgi:D-arabinose 1-dehydrogenase-like Zn-dependent alcohol dehydrogenase
MKKLIINSCKECIYCRLSFFGDKTYCDILKRNFAATDSNNTFAYQMHTTHRQCPLPDND